MRRLTTSLKDNVSLFSGILQIDKNFDLIYKDMVIDGVKAGFFFIDGFVDDGIMQRILQYFYGLKKADLQNADYFASAGLPYVEVDVEKEVDTIVTNILSGAEN